MIINFQKHPLSTLPVLALNHISLLSDFGEPFYHYVGLLTEREDAVEFFKMMLDQQMRHQNTVGIGGAEESQDHIIIIHQVINLQMEIGQQLSERVTLAGKKKIRVRLVEGYSLKTHYVMRMGQIILKMINDTGDGNPNHMDVHVAFNFK